MLENTPSVDLLARFRAGDQRAADEMFRRYLGRLTALARSRLAPRVRRRVDAEDVVQSAYRSFFIRARNGQLSLQRGGDLWRLLVAITLHKLRRSVAHHAAACRSVRQEIATSNLPESLLRESIPGPEEAAALTETVEELLARHEPLARSMIEMRLQDYSLEEIARAVQRSERTVRRTLQTAHTLLKRLLASPSE